MLPRLTPVTPADNSVLFEIFVSSKAEQMSIVPWPEEVKKAFFESQFKAQNRHYFSNYPNGSFCLIRLEDQPIGRFYWAELSDEIRILDITLLPQFRNRGLGTLLLKEILKDGDEKMKPVRIYLDAHDKSRPLFSRLGFYPVADDGVNCLWERKPAPVQTDIDAPANAAADAAERHFSV